MSQVAQMLKKDTQAAPILEMYATSYPKSRNACSKPPHDQIFRITIETLEYTLDLYSNHLYSHQACLVSKMHGLPIFDTYAYNNMNDSINVDTL